MKKMKRIIALLTAMIMVFGMSIAALAAQSGGGTITVENATKGQTYTAYKIFDATFAGTDGVSYKVLASKADQVSTTLFEVDSTEETIDGQQYCTVIPKKGIS